MSKPDAVAFLAAERRRKLATTELEREHVKAELAALETRHLGNTLRLAKQLEQLTHLEARVTILGYVQRGGTPSVADRAAGNAAGHCLRRSDRPGRLGVMVAARGGGVRAVPIEEVAGIIKTVPAKHQWIEAARRVAPPRRLKPARWWLESPFPWKSIVPNFWFARRVFLAAGLCWLADPGECLDAALRIPGHFNQPASARRNVTSDLVIWRARFSVQADTLMAAQQRLKEDRAKVEAWLRLHAIQDFQLQPVQIADIRSRGNKDDDTTTKLIGTGSART